MANNGLMQCLQNAFGRLAHHRPRVRSRSDRRLAPLQELEARCLLSVTPVGAEYRVNTFTQGNQQTFPQTPHAVAMNPANGNYVVVWSSQGQNGGGSSDVYFQRYNAAGVPLGAETLVDIPVSNVNQQFANVAMNSSGNFVVTWSSQLLGNWNVYARQFNANGVAQGLPILVDAPTSADQEYSTVALNDAGNFVVAWSNHASGTWQIYADAFNSSGVSLAFGAVTNATGDQLYPDVALNNANNVVITWSGHQSSNWNVYAELFTSLNHPVGTIFQVNTNTAADQTNSAIAMDAAGNFTITWSGHQTGNWNIYAQSYLASGAANSANFQVSAADSVDHEYASIAFAGDGNAFITWSRNGGGANGWGIYVQQFTPTGTLVGGEIHVNTFVVGDQIYSSVAGADNGNVAIVWTSQNQDGNGAGVYGQNFTTSVSKASVNLTGSDFLVTENNSVLRINALTGAVVATYPTGLASDGATFGPDGSLYVADYSNNQIDHYNASGALLSSFGSGVLNSPQALTFGPDGNLYVANANGAVDQFSPTGTFLGTFIAAGTNGLTNAKAIVWGPDGNAYVSSFFNSEVIRFNGTTGAFMNVFATGSGGFEGITFGPDGNLYAASYFDNTVDRYDGATGASLGAFVSGPELANPFSVSYDPAGNLDVVNRTSGDIQTFSGANGAFLGTLASGLTRPAYLSSGNSSVYGAAVTYTATVSAVAPATGTPMGSVTFVDGTTDLATVPIIGGIAVYTTTALTVGSHDITADYSGDSNFVATESTALIQGITPASLTITANDATKTYGQTLTFAGTAYTTSGLVNSDAVTGVVLASAGAGATASVAGSPYVINISGATGTGLSNYTISYVNGSLTITPASLTITADDASKVYGQTLTFAGTEFNTRGLVNADSVASVTLGSAGAAPNAGVAGSPYAIVASNATGSDLGNYDISYVNGNLTVSPAVLTVTADDAGKVYGQANPVLTDTLSGFVNRDTGAVVSGNASVTTAANVASPVGSYTITAAPGSLSAANYTFVFANGTLTVSPAVLTVTANNASKVAGQANPVLTDTIAGFVNADTGAVVSGHASLATTATEASRVGTYPITANQGSLSAANYTFAFANGTLTVSPANGPPTVKPVSQPTPPSLPGSLVLMPTPSPVATAGVAANSAPAANASASSHSAALALTSITVASDARSGNPSTEGGTQAMTAQAELFANRAMLVFAPVPRSNWAPANDVATLPADSAFDVAASRISPSRTTLTESPTAQADDGLDMLNDEGERVPWNEPGLETTMVLGSGVVATGGYVLLNSRLGLWLLGLLTSQPLWKQFDPLDVLYAWDADRVTEDPDEETLLSLVD